MTETYKNWRLEKDQDNILWLYFDKEGAKVNTFNVEALQELDSLIDHISRDDESKGLIITSGKTASFIAGADIEQFVKVSNEKEAYDFVSKAHGIFNRLENLKIPTLALINGICLGGGTELSLACDYRVADDDRKTKIGLPEVMLGIFPGWGGSVRLPRLIGAIKAMGLMLTGRTVSARAAAKMGIVDAAVPTRQLHKAAREFILRKPKKHAASTLEALTNTKLVRKFLAKKMRQQVASKKITKNNYPAPYALIANWEKYGVSKKAFDGEAKAVAKLVMSKTAQNLIRVFFLQQKMKSLGKGVNFKPKHIHVIGAGTMGGDIAAWCAFHGMKVTLQDREMKYIAPAIKRANKLYMKKLKKHELVQPVLDRLMPDVDGLGATQADVVVEAIFENVEAKQKLFKELESKMKPDAIMASNTSSIPLDEINTVLDHPERLVGIHFFNPVAKMPLVEIVKGDKTSDEVMGKAIAFVRAIDHLPLPVKSHPGFLVNRILMPYLMESLTLYQEGIPGPVIDKAAVKFGMPMGPIELADTVGLDICLSVAKNLAQHFGTEVPEFLQQKVDKGELGAKTGQGFYKFSKGKPIKAKDTNSSNLSDRVIADRLILRILNESVACLREGIVSDPDLLDAGMIFGTGFAPFRGGPEQHIKTVGAKNVLSRLNEFKDRFGDRYTPDAGWNK